MPTATHKIGESFTIQFIWRLPDGDYLRAVFEADVLDFVPASDKYIVRLSKLVAGRQETSEGVMRPKEQFSQEYWILVGQIVGRRVSIAYEASDGRPLPMRLATLIGEHNFFTQFDDAMEKLKDHLP